MNIAEYAIKNRVISFTFTLLLLVIGYLSFGSLGQLEMPEFTIKQAMVVTGYPGASTQQVEEEVTLQLEDAIQQLEYVDHITSINSPGQSQITVEMKPIYRKRQLAQIWDELRRKVNDQAALLPPGVQEPVVIDDFGDVYGLWYLVTGKGYSNKDISRYLDQLRRELVLVDGVSKVVISGEAQERIYIEISRAKMTNLGISLDSLINTINAQNVVSNAGDIYTGNESIRISPSGEYQTLKDLENLLISSEGGKLVYLSDLADIKRGEEDKPSVLYHYNGQSAVSLGVAFASQVNVVDVGAAVNERINNLDDIRPLGIDIHPVYQQPELVSKAVNGFLINLVEAIAIVIAVLLLFMGVKTGILMGLNLLLTILGTFILMKLADIDLQLISLGALIIALGMLVDNAIVITEGVLIGLHRGQSVLNAAKSIVSQTQWPLLGATVIAILAFAPIGLSPDATGEFVGSLFWVLMFSLLLSWVTALTITPFFCSLFFKSPKESKNNLTENNTKLPTEEKNSDPYGGRFYQLYLSFLSGCIRFRWLSLLVVFSLLVVALGGFSKVKQSFFPDSTTPIYYVDLWLPRGTDQRATEVTLSKVERKVLKFEGVKEISSVVGRGAQRFVLTYAPMQRYENYAQLIVQANDLQQMEQAMAKTLNVLRSDFPEVKYKVNKMALGPSPAAKIEARFSGSDPAVLRRLAAKAQDIILQDALADSIRHNWQEKSKWVEPEFLEDPARRAGVSRVNLDDALSIGFGGKTVQALFRQYSDLIPMVVRAPASERLLPSSIYDIQLWSPQFQTYIPIEQVINGFNIRWENSLIMRRDRIRTLTVLAEPLALSGETANNLFKRLKPQLEAMELPEGYRLSWGGEHESSSDAQAALASSLPMAFLAMFLITLFLFGTVRDPLVIWLTVPLAMIGISAGLLSTGAAFGFMSILGTLSLTGMVIKNGIVLVQQINIENEQSSQHSSPLDALLNASVSRLRPVSMAAITTILGLIPLFTNAFFQSMAVTISFGLGFATVLTLVVLPILYAVFYRIKS